MAQAVFKKGSPQMGNFTPSRNFTAGDVIPVSTGVYIAHRDMVSGELSSAGVAGGIYEFAKVSDVNQALPEGVKVYWSPAVSAAVSLATGNKTLGVTVEGDAAAADLTAKVLHLPPSP